MKKRFFAVFAAILFVGSTMSMAPIVDNTSDPDCQQQVVNLVRKADMAGYTTEEVEWFAQAALAVYCYGYTWEEVYAAD